MSATARPARGRWQSPPGGGPGYLQRLKRKPGLLGCAEEALEVAVEFFTSLAAAGYDLPAHFQVIDVDSTTGITLLVRQLGFQIIYDRASAFGGGPACKDSFREIATGLMVTVALPFSWPKVLAGSQPTV